jgi:hypothetical protein
MKRRERRAPGNGYSIFETALKPERLDQNEFRLE